MRTKGAKKIAGSVRVEMGTRCLVADSLTESDVSLIHSLTLVDTRVSELSYDVFAA